MAFKFHLDQSLPDNLRRLFQGQLARVTATLASPPDGDLFAAGSDAGLFQIDNVTVVPEPATPAAVGGVALAA